MVLEAAALLSILLCLGLAVLWLVRHPNLTDFDEVGHIDNALSDAVILRTGNAGILRDALFLWNRWQPPGLRLVGLPIAVVFWPVAPEALRLASGAMFLLTALVLWLALRRLAGRAGAAAGVLLYAVSPVNLFGAQNFMTESVLHLSAALTLCLLVAEAQASRASIPRMALLGLVMGLGMLTKLTFLPTLGIIWLGVAVHGWWRDRNAADLGVRLLLPAIGMLLLAWPHYALNGSRFLVNLRLAAAGLGVEIWPETGLEFAARATRTLVASIFGLSGTILLLSGLALLLLAWRRVEAPQRFLVVLAGLAALPALLGFLLSSNHADRYLGLSIVALTLPVALGFGLALRGRPAPMPAALVALSGAAVLTQAALVLAIVWWGPVPAWPLAGLVKATSRPNFDCDYSPLVALAPPGSAPVAIGLFGSSQPVSHATIAFPFLRAGRRTGAYDLSDWEGNLDWKAIVEEASRQDLLVIPKEAGDQFQGNWLIPEFEERLSAAGVRVEDRGELHAGPSPLCTVRVLTPAPGSAISPARGPFRSEVYSLP